ncbi:MAG: insulinase family protein, partial [Bacteroidales bacterium]|nr:insulinase family protein [Bacteroidales bacterium]
YINQMENRLKEKDKITNDQYAREYESHYLNKNAFLDIEVEFQIMQALYASITLDDYTSRLPRWFSSKNNVMIVQGPESEEINHLSEAEAVAIIGDVEAMEITPYEDVEVATSLISEELALGTVVSEKLIPELDAEEWILSNGAKVVYRFADYEKDNIEFKAYSKGGSSLYGDELVPSMSMLPSLIPFYGVADYDQMTLQKMLTGKTVTLDIQLNDLSEGLSGSSSPKDFETLMQLIYLRFTLPRFDVEAHQAIIGRYLAFVENMNKNPQKIMNDSLTQILTNYHPRTRVMDTEFINEVDLEQVKEVYTERFSDASDFTFYFVGNISKEELLPFVEKYLATLPSKQSNESWVDLNIDEPKGKVTKEIKLSLSVPKSTVFLVFNKEMEYTAENKVLLSMLQGILDLRFTESIREEEGGTYGVRTSASISHFPDEKATLLIMFDTDPLKADHLKGLVYKELENLIKNGPEQKDLSKTIENMLKDRVENREHNSYWMGTLHNYYVQGYNFNNPANFEDIVKSATTKDIKQLMKKLYKGANVVDLVFSPEELPVEE